MICFHQNRCDFDRNTHVCGAVEGHHVPPTVNPTGSPSDSQGQCRSGLLSVFVGGPNSYNYQGEWPYLYFKNQIFCSLMNVNFSM